MRFKSTSFGKTVLSGGFFDFSRWAKKSNFELENETKQKCLTKASLKQKNGEKIA